MLHALETVLESHVALAGKLSSSAASPARPASMTPSAASSRAPACAPTWRCWAETAEITLGNRGRVDIFITVKGAPCHSSRPWDGVNAITGATALIALLRDKVQLARIASAARRADRSTVNRIRSFPDSTHTVQERCELTLDRRLLPGDDPEEAFAEIERIARSSQHWPIR